MLISDQRATENDEPNGDLPLLIRVLYRYGVIAAIAAFLIWFVTGQLNTKVDDSNRKMDLTQHLLEQHISEQRYYLRAICVNTARDDAQRAGCIPNQ